MLFGDWFSQLFDDAPWTEGSGQTFVDNVLSDLLSYRVYDREMNFFHNEGSVGFILEASPMVGGEDIGTLTTAVNNYCPSDGTVQFINWTSPNLDEDLNRWARAKVVETPLTVKMTENRSEHLRDLCFGSEGLIKCVPHKRRIFVCGWVDSAPTNSSLKLLNEFRRNLILALGGPRLAYDLQPEAFINLICEILHARGNRFSDLTEYDEDTPLNYQFPGASVTVLRDGLTFLNDPQMSVSSASVRSVPAEWTFALGSLFNGAPERPEDSPHGPVLTSLVARAQNVQKTSAELVKKRASIIHAKETKFGKYMPDLGERDEEVTRLQSEVELGERLFETVTTVSAYGRGGVEESGSALTEMGKIYRGAGLNLEKDTFLQLPIFLAGLPFEANSALFKDLAKASRVKKRKGSAVVALAPIHGEWTGSTSPRGMQLVGRQGQAFRWDPFDSSGNYNIAITGKSGAGKSVFMQDLIANIYSGGGRVLIIDDGKSFKTTCELFGGRWVGLSGGNSIRLNPFSIMDEAQMENQEYLSDALEMLTRLVATMVDLGEQREGRVTGIEEEFIRDACFKVWHENGNEGEVTDVYDILVEDAKKEDRLADVITKLRRFCRGGLYGSMFSGPANISLDNAFTVFEMSEIKAQKDLEAVVLQMVMFLGVELMFKTDRSTRVAIVIDEAWDMLGSPGTASFLEGVVRRARKYQGSLITGTQSPSDYFEMPGARVCMENSDWSIFLAQKPEVIDALVNEGNLNVVPGTAYALKKLVSVRGQFSELAIRGPDGWAFGRLVIDPYSLAVYSSNGETVTKLEHLRESRGLSIADALDELVSQGHVV